MRKLLILDCDGVLYPAANISHSNFVTAFFKTMEYFGMKEALIDEEKISCAAEFWNVIYKMCRNTGCEFDEFCRKMIENVDYKKIRKSQTLLSLLKATKKNFDIVVLSDNHHYHLEQVLKQRFNLGINDFAKMGIHCYDITSTKQADVFLPKSRQEGLRNFLHRQNRKVEECIFVDNSRLNIAAGRKIGMESVYIYKNRSLQKYLREINN